MMRGVERRGLSARRALSRAAAGVRDVVLIPARNRCCALLFSAETQRRDVYSSAAEKLIFSLFTICCRPSVADAYIRHRYPPSTRDTAPRRDAAAFRPLALLSPERQMPPLPPLMSLPLLRLSARRFLPG